MDIQHILEKIDGLLKENSQRDFVLQKICEILKQDVYHYDWVGFYILDESKQVLILGPYVGKPTDHTMIPVGKGVCGQVAESGQAMIVQDVSQISNYIACSLHVVAEIVVPVIKNGKFVAEIDIDSHSPAPFRDEDEQLLESIAERIARFF
ncbi:MAG: GAF domain-containing protein [Prolixibacteraceae bacterium]|nr:GAF domain-containing protein [Prolixibacteraceae bacterium]